MGGGRGMVGTEALRGGLLCKGRLPPKAAVAEEVGVGVDALEKASNEENSAKKGSCCCGCWVRCGAAGGACWL